MKKYIIVLTLLWVTGGMISAQTITGPQHPMKPRMPRSMADSSVRKTYLEGGNDKPLYTVSEAVYKYSKDRLTDTATHISGTIDCFISKYSQDGHLLYRSDYFPRKVELDGKVYPDREWNILKYTYGDDGRLLKTENYDVDYSHPNKDKLFGISEYTYMITDSGYIVDRTITKDLDKGKGNIEKEKIEYVLDKGGRVVRSINRNDEDKYVSGINGHRYRIGDHYYSYTDSGYTDVRYLDVTTGLRADFMYKDSCLLKENV
ncbi:MAG: hypothetical protein ACFNUG_09305 [Tannerella forsythia]|uniref:hypothetical protein n=1 Tax=Tannerella forsythia TaxID=28112 RepID=UPI000A408717|nr:hypothetical protein [Tannerella forsythia]